MAAGLGFKTFTTGEVLTAADTNGYLMQGVLVFASSAARAAAITSPQEGQYSYLKDTNSTEYYDGAAWIAAPIGDITGVTAGTGISGGGTSGTVTITNSMATEIAAKGDLIAGTGSATFDNLTVGANNTVLTADSSTATGLKWATAAAGAAVYGKTLTAGSNKSTTSTSYVAIDSTNLRITATPTSTTAYWIVSGFQNNSGVTTADWRVNAGAGTVYGYAAYNNSYDGTAVPRAVCQGVITGLTAGTSYNFDWEWKVNAGTTNMIGDTATVYPRMSVIC
jgi:hypothetical protein